MWRCCVFVVATAGCIDSLDLAPCGDALCASDRVCLDLPAVDDVPTCVPDDLGRACDGLADGAGCGPDATCRAGVCVARACGNWVVEVGEACDDGATQDGDGCSATCAIETCGNAQADPGEECDCGDDQAATRPAACAGLANGDDTDRFCRSDCRLVGCGNGAVELGEVCDDGNTLAADGCAPDCRSDEVCGNGVRDVSEACDDGDRINHDGCSTRCLVESPRWREGLASNPPQRRDAAAAYDVARQRVVMFGGVTEGDNPLDDTWEWDGASWVPRGGAPRPPARSGHAMTYDPVAHRVVLVGGRDRVAQFADLWRWDGERWTEASAPGLPLPGRSDHALAADPARAELVLFGGCLDVTCEERGTETYVLDLTAAAPTWTLANSVLAPAARAGGSMAYQPGQGLAFYGYAGTQGAGLDDELWHWRDDEWHVTAVEPVGTASRIVFDVGRQTLVAHSDIDADSLANGRAWALTTACPSTSPCWTEIAQRASGFAYALAYDVARRESVLFGGQIAAGGTFPLARTLALGAAWDERDKDYPALSDGTGMTFAPPLGNVLLWRDSVAAPCEEWSWSGQAFRRIAPNTTFSCNVVGPRFAASSSDTVFGLELEVGGGFHVLAWAGRDGAGLDAGPAVLHLGGEAVAWDPADQRLLVIGGAQLDGTPSAEVFAYDDGAWSSVALSDPLEPRADTACATAPDGGGVICFGGAQGDVLLGDTFEIQGSTLTTIATATRPPVRKGAALTLDPVRGRLLLVGGTGSTGDLDDTWEFDGATWRFVGADGPIGASVAAFDPLASQAIALDWLGNASALQLTDGGVDEACRSGIDYDGDGAIGCADLDCWGYCAPACDPHRLAAGTCPAEFPRCGDSTCDAVEDCRICPGDCGACPAACGDLSCDAPETAVSCPGDCPP